MWTWILFIAAFLVRLIGLNQSLWLDEATTARVVARYNPLQIITVFSPTDFHPPLYYLFLDMWSSVFGYSEVALRMPSVIFSLIAGFILYKRFGNWTTALFLFNPLVMYYSQEARMYMMTVMFVTASYYFFLGHLEKPDKKVTVLLFHIFTLLSLLTFYGSVFYVAALVFYLFLKKRFHSLFRLMFMPVFAALLAGPLFMKQLSHSGEQLNSIVNWSSVLGTATVKNLLLFPIKFVTGRISWEPKSGFYLITGLWTVFVFGTLAHYINHNHRKRKLNIKTPVFFFTVPIILGIIVSFYKPLLQYFRFIFVIPFLSIVMGAAGARNVWTRRLFLTGFILFSFAYLLNPSIHREDWKKLVTHLPPVSAVYMIPSSSDPVLYYNSNLTIKDLRTSTVLPDSMYVIPYTMDIHGFDYQTHLTERGYTKLRDINERGVSAELWSRKKSFAQSRYVSQPF